MKILLIITTILIAQVSASFFDVFQGAVLSVQNSFGKILSDVVTDVRDTVDCTILAVEHALSLSDDATSRYYQKCGNAANKTVSENSFQLDASLPHNVSLQLINNEEYLEKQIPVEINVQINETLSRVVGNYEPWEKSSMVENALAKESEQLVEISEIVNEEWQKLSSESHNNSKNMHQKDPSIDSILQEIKLLKNRERMTQNNTEASEIHHVIDEVLDKLDVIEATDASENVKIEEILTNLENNSSSTFNDLRHHFDEWKEIESRHLTEIKNKMEEHEINVKNLNYIHKKKSEFTQPFQDNDITPILATTHQFNDQSNVIPISTPSSLEISSVNNENVTTRVDSYESTLKSQEISNEGLAAQVKISDSPETTMTADVNKKLSSLETSDFWSTFESNTISTLNYNGTMISVAVHPLKNTIDSGNESSPLTEITSNIVAGSDSNGKIESKMSDVNKVQLYSITHQSLIDDVSNDTLVITSTFLSTQNITVSENDESSTPISHPTTATNTINEILGKVTESTTVPAALAVITSSLNTITDSYLSDFILTNMFDGNEAQLSSTTFHSLDEDLLYTTTITTTDANSDSLALTTSSYYLTTDSDSSVTVVTSTPNKYEAQLSSTTLHSLNEDEIELKETVLLSTFPTTENGFVAETVHSLSTIPFLITSNIRRITPNEPDGTMEAGITMNPVKENLTFETGQIDENILSNAVTMSTPLVFSEHESESPYHLNHQYDNPNPTQLNFTGLDANVMNVDSVKKNLFSRDIITKVSLTTPKNSMTFTPNQLLTLHNPVSLVNSYTPRNPISSQRNSDENPPYVRVLRESNNPPYLVSQPLPNAYISPMGLSNPKSTTATLQEYDNFNNAPLDHDSLLGVPQKNPDTHEQALAEALQLIESSKRAHQMIDWVLKNKSNYGARSIFTKPAGK